MLNQNSPRDETVKSFLTAFIKKCGDISLFFLMLEETEHEESTETENLQVKAKRMGKDSEI